MRKILFSILIIIAVLFSLGPTVSQVQAVACSTPGKTASGQINFYGNCIKGENTGLPGTPGECDLFYTKHDETPPGSRNFSGRVQGWIGPGQKTGRYCVNVPACGDSQVDIDLWKDSSMSQRVAGGGVIDGNPPCPSNTAPTCSVSAPNACQSQSQTFSATCNDSSGLDKMGIYYRVPGGSWSEPVGCTGLNGKTSHTCTKTINALSSLPISQLPQDYLT